MQDNPIVSYFCENHYNPQNARLKDIQKLLLKNDYMLFKTDNHEINGKKLYKHSKVGFGNIKSDDFHLMLTKKINVVVMSNNRTNLSIFDDFLAPKNKISVNKIFIENMRKMDPVGMLTHKHEVGILCIDMGIINNKMMLDYMYNYIKYICDTLLIVVHNSSNNDKEVCNNNILLGLKGNMPYIFKHDSSPVKVICMSTTLSDKKKKLILDIIFQRVFIRLCSQEEIQKFYDS